MVAQAPFLHKRYSGARSCRPSAGLPGTRSGSRRRGICCFFFPPHRSSFSPSSPSKRGPKHGPTCIGRSGPRQWQPRIARPGRVVQPSLVGVLSDIPRLEPTGYTILPGSSKRRHLVPPVYRRAVGGGEGGPRPRRGARPQQLVERPRFLARLRPTRL